MEIQYQYMKKKINPLAKSRLYKNFHLCCSISPFVLFCLALLLLNSVVQNVLASQLLFQWDLIFEACEVKVLSLTTVF